MSELKESITNTLHSYNHSGHIVITIFSQKEPYNNMRTRKKWRLNLGCQENMQKGFINCDKDKNTKPDLILDFNMPLPFKNSCINHVVLDGVLAHVTNKVGFWREILRIMKGSTMWTNYPVDILLCSCCSDSEQMKGVETFQDEVSALSWSRKYNK